MRRVTRKQKLSVNCPRCGAKVGDWCRATPHFSLRRGSTRTGSVRVHLNMRFPTKLEELHRERREAFLGAP